MSLLIIYKNNPYFHNYTKQLKEYYVPLPQMQFFFPPNLVLCNFSRYFLQ